MAYSFKLVQDYINGGELEGYNVEDLENDPEFMKLAFLASGDKKLYNLCSINVKYDYDFVCFLIDKFKDDPTFIDEVADNYIKAVGDDKLRIGVITKMCNILKDSNDKDLYSKYRVLFVAKFFMDLIGIDYYKAENPADDDLIGLGFIVFLDEYGYDPDIIKCYAEQLVQTLLDDHINLADEIHKEFRTPNDIYKGGLVNYMIGFIRRYDESLADYAMVHPDILDYFQEKINKIQVRWNKYTNKEEEYKYEVMFDRVHEYYEKEGFMCTIGEEEFMYYIGKELGISEKLARYGGLDRETYEMIYGDAGEKIVPTLLSNFQDRLIYSSIKKIMLEEIFGEKEEEKHGECQIIEFDFKRGRK